jgi:hypothetical protein
MSLYDFLSRRTTLLECGEGEPDACLAIDEEDGVANCQNEDTEVHGTGSPQGGSTIGGTPSVPQCIAQDDADGDRRGCMTAHVSRQRRPSGKKSTLAGRKMSRSGGDAGVSEDEIGLTDAPSASTQQIS